MFPSHCMSSESCLEENQCELNFTMATQSAIDGSQFKLHIKQGPQEKIKNSQMQNTKVSYAIRSAPYGTVRTRPERKLSRVSYVESKLKTKLRRCEL